MNRFVPDLSKEQSLKRTILKRFLKVPDDANKDVGKVWHGRQALERMFPELKAQHDNGTLKLDGLTKFHMFDWLVPEQQMCVFSRSARD